MFKYNIKNNYVLDENSDIGKYTLSTPIDEQFVMNKEDIRELEKEYRIRAKLNVNSVYNNNWNNVLLEKVFSFSYPLRKLLKSNTQEYLNAWELYSYFESIEKNSNVMFIGEFTEMSKILKENNKVNIEEIAGLKGVDSSNKFNVSNMRAWKNNIDIALKPIHTIISNYEVGLPSVIIFTLMNLSIDGSAYVLLPYIKTSALVSAIHLFSMCFKTAEILHTIANDKIYLCGNNLEKKIDTDKFYKFCSNYPNYYDVTMFTKEYIITEVFDNTIDNILMFNNKTNAWRYKYYEKLLVLTNKLKSSASSKIFAKYDENLLSSYYKEKSDKWIQATNFK
jgi:hypothetical protein